MNFYGSYEPAETYPGSVSRRSPDITHSKEILKYSPQFNWKDAVELTVEWYKEFYANGNKPESGGFKPPEDTLK